MRSPVGADGSDETTLFTFSVLASGHFTTALSGLVDAGGGVAAELARAEGLIVPVARLGLGAGSGRTLTSDAGAMAYALHAIAQLDVGARLATGVIRPELGAVLQVLAMEVRATSAIDNRASLRWLAAFGGYARASALLSDWQLAVEFAGGPSLTRERYLIDPDGLVFAVPVAWVSAQLQLGFSLP